MSGFRPVFRGRELLLLLAANAVILTGLALVAAVNGRPVSAETARQPLLYLGAIWLLHIGLSLTGRQSDQMILPVTTALSGVGLVMVTRLVDPQVADRQVLWLLLGIAAAAATMVAAGSPVRLRRFKYSVATAGLLLVALTLLFGRDLNGSGARLWLGIGDFNFQPSELLKVLLVVFLAAYLDEYAPVLARGHYRLGKVLLPPVPYLIPLVVMWGLAVLIVVVQRDLGAALLFFGIFLSMLYLASGRALYVLVGLASFGLALWVAYHLVPIFHNRVDIWLDPWSQSSGLGYQVVQALIALASGGVFGSGIGLGRPDLVPAVHTDYILVAIGEEAGLAGALAMLLLFALLIARGYAVAQRAPTDFLRLLTAGLTSVLAIQTLVIVAGVLKLIPLTGITLPFVSYGGSSIVTNSIILGFLLGAGASKPASQP